MSSLKRLFERRCTSEAGITSESDWLSFGNDLNGFGLGTPGLMGVLDQVWAEARANGRAVTYLDIINRASTYNVDKDADNIIQDLRQDSAALRRFVEYVRSRYSRGSIERGILESGLEDVAESYRVGLLHLLRLATKEAAAIDARQRENLLIGPIETALRIEHGSYITIDSLQVTPSPFQFQRTFSHAISIRLASIYVRSAQLIREHKLYRLDKPSAADAARQATEVIAEKMGMNEGYVEEGGIGGNIFKMDNAPTPGFTLDAAAADASQVCVYFSRRHEPNPEDCAASAIPYYIETVRVPALSVIDAVSSASTTLGAFYSAAAIVPSLYQPHPDPHAQFRFYGDEEHSQVLFSGGNALSAFQDGNTRSKVLYNSALSAVSSSSRNGYGDSSNGSGGLDLNGSKFSMETGEFASHMGAGGTVVPAPSSLPNVARAHASSSYQMYADYTAHTELILSPYFADTCGLHEIRDTDDFSGFTSVSPMTIMGPDGSSGDGIRNTTASKIFGSSTLFCYEYIPDMVPLSQLISFCGRLPESRPLFRHLARELAQAFADIETQCTFSVPPGGISPENVYVTDRGTRLILRGIAWGSPISPDTDSTDMLLRARSRTLLSSLGSILRAMLVESNVTRFMKRELLQNADALAGEEAEGLGAAMDSISGGADIAGARGRGGAQAQARQQLASMRISPEDDSGSVTSSSSSSSSAVGVPSEEVGASQEADTAKGASVQGLVGTNIMIDPLTAELGVHACEDDVMHVLLPHSHAELGLNPVAIPQEQLEAMQWSPPLLVLPGTAPGELSGARIEAAVRKLAPSTSSDGVFMRGGLPVQLLATRVEEDSVVQLTGVPAYSDAAVSGFARGGEGHMLETVKRVRTRVCLQGNSPGQAELIFYLVPSSLAKEMRSPVARRAQLAQLAAQDARDAREAASGNPHHRNSRANKFDGEGNDAIRVRLGNADDSDASDDAEEDEDDEEEVVPTEEDEWKDEVGRGPSRALRAYRLAVAKNGFLIGSPAPSEAVATIRVKINVHVSSPSPVLASILDSCDPLPGDSAAIATLRLLSAQICKATGMVRGRLPRALSHSLPKSVGNGADSGHSASSEMNEENASGGQSSDLSGNLGPNAGVVTRRKSNNDHNRHHHIDPMKDDESFLAVMRLVAAVLYLNTSVATDSASELMKFMNLMDVSQGQLQQMKQLEHAQAHLQLGSAAAAAASAAASASAAAASGNVTVKNRGRRASLSQAEKIKIAIGDSATADAATSQVSEMDSLAALIAAMEQDPSNGELAREDLGGPLGSSAAHNPTGLVGGISSGSGTGGARRNAQVQWVAHLARHPYFAGLPEDGAAVENDWKVYVWPLQRSAGIISAASRADFGRKRTEALNALQQQTLKHSHFDDSKLADSMRQTRRR